MDNVLIVKIGGILLNNNNSTRRLFKELQRYSRLTKQKIIIVNGSGSAYKMVFDQCSSVILDNSFCSLEQLNTKKILYSMLPNIVNFRLLAWSKKYDIQSKSVFLPDFFSSLIDVSCNINIIHSFLNQNKLRILEFLILLKKYLKKNFIPFICSSGIDNSGNVFHIDSDVVAMILTVILNGRLIFLTDVSSVLNGKGQSIKKISSNKISDLFSTGVVTNGMMIKIQSALIVTQILKKSVEIASWHDQNNLFDLLKGKSIGTRIVE